MKRVTFNIGSKFEAVYDDDGKLQALVGVSSERELRIVNGMLPRSLEGGDWNTYGVRGAGYLMTTDWDNWCRMWLAIAWVRLNGFRRDAGEL